MGTVPEQILLSTFTNRATREFKGRLAGLLGGSVGRLNIGTLHSIGARLLRGYAPYIGYPNDFRIIPTPGSQNIIKRLLKNNYGCLQTLGSVVLESTINRYKDRLIPPDGVEKAACNPIEVAIAQLYGEYQQYLREKKAMDFADLISNSIVLLQSYPEVSPEVGLQHILVDEFQDTNAAQFTMIKLLLGESRNLTVVGDIDQSIYAFRGADHQIMCNFQNHYPDATQLSLGENYRCPGNIVTAAAGIVTHNRNRIAHHLSTCNPPGELIVHISATDETDEAAKVAQQIQTILRRTNIPAHEIAVLYRTNTQSKAIAERLAVSGLPYYLTPEYSGEPGKEEGSDHEGVQLLTIHSAKGTEYEVVFLIGVEENLLPHWRALNDSVDFMASLEEERRLLYVAMTRAKKMLYLSSARNRVTPTGRELISAPSRFLREIPEHLMVRWGR